MEKTDASGSSPCRLCQLAGNPPLVTHSHTTAECGSLSGSEREELFVRLRSIYLGETSVEELKTVKQGQPAEALFNTLQPVPSQLLNVDYEGKKLTITLDSGATVSFCSPALVQRLGLTLQPNSQLALLADSRFRVRSKGEVDFLVVEETTAEALLRVRALVIDNLAVDCYGGQTFHMDNAVSGDVSGGRVILHGGRWEVRPGNSGASKPKPPPAESVKEMQGQEGAALRAAAISRSGETVLMKPPKYLLPDGTYTIPTRQDPSVEKVLVLPPTSGTSQAGPRWRPQICEVVKGAAMYVNRSPIPLHHHKHTHFKTIPMMPALANRPPTLHTKAANLSKKSIDKDAILSQIQVNRELLSDSQMKRLDAIHTSNIRAFDEDMSKGYQNEEHPYQATFSFRQENMAPPYKIWVPQFSRKCQDLMQAKCDQLEEQGVLVDPKIHKIDIRHVSPSFIQQKARAKHKQLDDCTLDEVRFISCFNVLNESIHPIPGRSNSYNDIIKFFGRHKFLICADLSSSYFQIMVHQRLWRFLGVMTPFRGIKLMTRLGQGLLNSDVELDQALAQVLGDEMTEGFCCVARDDLFIGGETEDECIDNWERVLVKLNTNNLKLAPRKVRIMLQDTEVFGHRFKDGKMRPSDHIVTSLGKTSVEELKTVKQVNSWKGLYKTLIRHLPHLASQMGPFDTACASKTPTSIFDWSQPGLIAAFNSATKHLEEVRETYLPHPDEQLVLLPDTSTSNLCSGWVLYTQRISAEGTRWLPVQYASARLPRHMATWTPCEQEAVGAVLSIDQVRHWINESRRPTMVLPDNKPVADAANMMRIGRHSKNGRLQTLLNSVNRSSVTFTHNSAKAGHHVVPDELSRTPGPVCTTKDCKVERFLHEMPDKVQCMAVSLEGLALSSTTPAMLAATTTEVGDAVGLGSGPIPLGSRQAWIVLQAACADCRRFVECKRLGQVPGRKDKDRTVLNQLIKKCEVDRGLIVTKEFDPILMKEAVRTFVPSSHLASILTIMHTRLSHPPATQLQRVFERYFVALGVRNACAQLTEDCSLCVAVGRFPRELETYTPQPAPAHPGTHMNVDVLRRASQLIVVNCDRFSNFATATLTPSETREDLARAILAVITPIRHGARVEVRTDRAAALQSLANRPDQQLQANGIDLVLGDHGNPNSNCSVDKTIQELEAELRRISPDGGKLDFGTLSIAVNILNNKVREHGLSSSQVHFARDSNTGANLNLDDAKLKKTKEDRKARTNPITARSKARGGKEHIRAEVEPGGIVYLRSDGDKHTARNPMLVTAVDGQKVSVQRVLHSTPLHKDPPKITSQELKIDEKFLYVPPHRRAGGRARTTGGQTWGRTTSPLRTSQVPCRREEVWIPVDPPDDLDDYLEERPHPRQVVRQVPRGEREERPQREEQEELEEPQEVQEEPQQAHQEGQVDQRQEGHEEPQEQEEPAPPQEQEHGRRLREQAEGRTRVRELVRATLGGRREQERERVRATIDWGMEQERRRADELRRREELQGAGEPEGEELAAAEEQGEGLVQEREVLPAPGARERLGGISGTPHRDGRRQLTPAVLSASVRSRSRPVVRPTPAPDIDGRLVSEHELVRYDTSRTGDQNVRWELATVARMTKKLQGKHPNYYNVRLNSNNLVSKSVELLPAGTWQVWRSGRWWSPSEDRPAPDAQEQPQL